MTELNHGFDFHDKTVASAVREIMSGYSGHSDTKFTYTFENFFHPFVGELIAKLNRDSLPGMLDPVFHEGLSQKIDNPPKSDTFFTYFKDFYQKPIDGNLVEVEGSPKEIDVSDHGPYANYNWELFFHIPLTIAVHLSKSQRFAEAQRWFHFIFDPTANDQSIKSAERFWKFLAFRKPDLSKMRIEDIVRILSMPRSQLSAADQKVQESKMEGYTAILNKPFQPHVVARTRPLAYQYCVVMKYLDNLIAWGDSLFMQDTVESIGEATQLYVLAANILGERPQQNPPRGTANAKTFAQLKKDGLGPIGDAFVKLEGQMPFNLATTNSGSGGNGAGDSSALFGMGRTLYFCLPRNDKMLGYWDTVSDRLFKIRHCMNIEGLVRPLALFDPPIDPGMLVKAAAAGIDIGSIVSGLNQPVGPVRCLFLIQKALELCGEVRGLGGALLSALEKGDAEHLALVRQGHETQIQKNMQEVRFLQWASAQETTKSLLVSRAAPLERFHYYQRLLGLPPDPKAQDVLTLDFNTLELLTEQNFAKNYDALVKQYDNAIATQTLPQLSLAKGDRAARLHLSTNEDDEFEHLKRARDTGLGATIANALATAFAPVPDADADFHYWGIGGKVKLKPGTALVAGAKIAGDVLGIIAAWEREQAGMASKMASYERRADEWILQYNLAAHELMQIGRQILTSLIAEQVAYHEYLNTQQQIANAQEVYEFLGNKFTNEDLYLWMQGEISRLYYEYYRFAFDTARKAERTMKQELMRPELDDAEDFVKFNYWDGGRKGLLSGEALYLDVKRMEMAYHDNNKRELELTRHVSLRQLNPLALLTLKATGTCQVTVPEWLYDLDCPGHYMRRIKSVALSIPSVVGPYTSVNCTLSLLKSSLRKSPIVGEDGYARQGTEDERFVDYMGALQSIVTSSGQNDSGMFESNLRDERFLPFEGAGAESTWKLDLPKDYPAFDYNTIPDVILHIRYTARQGVEPTKVKDALDKLLEQPNQAKLALLFSLRHEFPTQWSAFVKGNDDFAMRLRRRDYFPYMVQGKELAIEALELHAQDGTRKSHPVPANLADDLNGANGFSDLSFHSDTEVLKRDAAAQPFLIVQYRLDNE